MKIAAGILAFAATLVLAIPARAQENKDELKRKILDEISKKLDEEMKRILEEVAKLIDDEIAKARGKKPAGEPSAPAAGKTGFLGVRPDAEQPDEDDFKSWKVDGGVRIVVVEGAPAEKAGLQDGDVITEVNGTKIKEPTEMPASLKSTKPGDKAKIKFIRGKEAKELTVTLGERSDAPAPPPRDPGPAEPPKVESRPGRLGISPGDATGKGMAIDKVSADTPAAKAGIQAGDVLVKLDETPIWKESDLEAFMKKARAGQKVEITILRGGEEKKFSVVLAER